MKSAYQWKSLVLMVMSLVASSNAFVARTAFHRPAMSLQLHPDQAADLEACAYDLMKQAAVEETVANNTEMQGRFGPVKWCRRVLLKNLASSEVMEEEE